MLEFKWETKGDVVPICIELFFQDKVGLQVFVEFFLFIFYFFVFL